MKIVLWFFPFTNRFLYVFIFLRSQFSAGFRDVTPHVCCNKTANHLDLLFSVFLLISFTFSVSLFAFLFLSSLLQLFPSAPRWQLDYHVSMQCQKLAARQNHVLSHPWLLQCDDGRQPMTLGTRERKPGVTRDKQMTGLHFHRYLFSPICIWTSCI